MLSSEDAAYWQWVNMWRPAMPSFDSLLDMRRTTVDTRCDRLRLCACYPRFVMCPGRAHQATALDDRPIRPCTEPVLPHPESFQGDLPGAHTARASDLTLLNGRHAQTSGTAARCTT